MRTEVRGGCLDGARVTLGRDGALHCGRSWWALDDDIGEYVFAGLGGLGREMAIVMEGFRMDRRDEQAALDMATRPRSCLRCGRTFIGSAYAVHFEAGEGSRCLPGDARGQLVEVDGVWCLPGSDAARR